MISIKIDNMRRYNTIASARERRIVDILQSFGGVGTLGMIEARFDKQVRRLTLRKTLLGMVESGVVLRSGTVRDTRYTLSPG